MLLDQFYTKPEVAKSCIDIVAHDFVDYDIILEPSAGTGNFLKQLPYNKRLGIDLDPKAEDIKKMDFFDFIPEWNKTYFVIGNPPFGRVNSLAVRFFNRAATFAEKIAFILPCTFRRISVQNRLDLRFHLVHDSDIPPHSFEPNMQAKCCFQVWEKQKKCRAKIILPLSTSDFEFVNPNQADYAIRAYGSNCGEISFNPLSLAPRSWHFIKEKYSGTLSILKRIDYSLSRDTARQDSIGKAELIFLYDQEKAKS